MKNKTGYKIITLIIPILLVTLLAMKNYIFSLVPYIPPCIVYSNFKLYCPACGNTRGVVALLKGNILTSLHYNVIPFLLFLLSVAAYTELASYSFGRHIRILPRRLSAYLIGIAFLVLYLILRNFIPALAP